VDTIAMASVWSPDLRRMLVTLDGDLYIVERERGAAPADRDPGR
jgi:hypothetical protein